MTQLVSLRVVAGICRFEGKILMGRRLEGDGFYGGYWEFPGGKSEEGESDEEALTRELREELGVKLDRLYFFEEVIWKYPARTVEIQFYWVDLLENDISKMKREAHSEIRWLSLSEALQLQVLPANVDVIRRIHASGIPEKS